MRGAAAAARRASRAERMATHASQPRSYTTQRGARAIVLSPLVRIHARAFLLLPCNRFMCITSYLYTTAFSCIQHLAESAWFNDGRAGAPGTDVGSWVRRDRKQRSQPRREGRTITPEPHQHWPDRQTVPSRRQHERQRTRFACDAHRRSDDAWRARTNCDRGPANLASGHDDSAYSTQGRSY